MKYCFSFALAMCFSSVSMGFGANRLPDYGKLPLSFEANQGQTAGEVKFLAHGRGYSLFLTPTEAVIAAPKTTALRMKFRGANPAPQISGVDEQPGKSNYFVGNDPSKWHSNVPTYSKVRYKNIYSGIDLVYYGNRRQLEYDFVVAPGADPRRIGFDVRGASSIRRDADGDLVVAMGLREIRWHKPVVYQKDSGIRRQIAGRYVIKGKHRVGFELAQYDQRKTLVIDPVLAYSTYLGGSQDDAAYAIAVDSLGSAYVTGSTGAANFPTANPLPPSDYGYGFVTKFNPSGSALLYSTYFGGTGSIAWGYGIAVDTTGNAYVAGVTSSTDFPTMNPLQPSLNGPTDAFIIKLSPSGAALVYSTYLGGSGDDQGAAIALDDTGAAYITGATTSLDFPTMNPLEPAYSGGEDAFVAKLSPSGAALVYSTYLGGNGLDAGSGIAVDSAGAAYVTGATDSLDFPTMNPFQPHLGGTSSNAFVTKFNPLGSALVYSTYLGGSGRDSGNGITVDGFGDVYVVGYTLSADFPIKSELQSVLGGTEDAFVTKLGSNGSLVYSTYLGGGGIDGGLAVAVDSSRDVYITGFTNSTNFPTLHATQPAFGGYYDAFVSEIDPSGSRLVYSSYLGGSIGEYGYGIAVDAAGSAYVTGWTESNDFPVVNAFQSSFGGGDDDAFVTKVALNATGTTLRLSENEWTFGPWVVGSASPQANVYVTNTGTTPAHFLSPLVSTLAGLQFDTTCGATLEPGAFCVVQFSYTASALGTVTGTLTLQSDAGNSPNVIQIVATGSGVLPQFYSWNFSTTPVGTTRATGRIYLKSETPAPMNLSSTVVSLGGADPGDFSLTDNCSAAVAPYQSCELLFGFTPTAVGYRQAQIVIASAQIQNGSVVIPIGGEGK